MPPSLLVWYQGRYEMNTILEILDNSLNFKVSSFISCRNDGWMDTWRVQLKCENEQKRYYCTMLQNVSKCEVKAGLCWNLIILLPLRTYVKSNFSAFKRLKNVIFGNFSNFEQLSSAKFTKNSKFRVSKMAKNDIFGLFEFAKIWFHIKSEWQ